MLLYSVQRHIQSKFLNWRLALITVRCVPHMLYVDYVKSPHVYQRLLVSPTLRRLLWAGFRIACETRRSHSWQANFSVFHASSTSHSHVGRRSLIAELKIWGSCRDCRNYRSGFLPSLLAWFHKHKIPQLSFLPILLRSCIITVNYTT